jgi:ferredoxin
VLRIIARHLKKSVDVAKVDPKLPLLDHAESKGLVLPYGCRSGSCGACRVTIFKGLDLLQPMAPIEEDTLLRCEDPPNVRLACQAQPRAGAQGDLELEPAPEIDPLL